MKELQLDLRIDEAVAKRLTPLLQKFEATLDALKSGPAAPKGPEPEFLSISTAARLAGLSYDHIRRAVQSGELPASDKGSGKKCFWRIARADFYRWMQKDRSGSLVPPRSDLKDAIRRYLPGVGN